MRDAFCGWAVFCFPPISGWRVSYVPGPPYEAGSRKPPNRKTAERATQLPLPREPIHVEACAGTPSRICQFG